MAFDFHMECIKTHMISYKYSVSGAIEEMEVILRDYVKMLDGMPSVKMVIDADMGYGICHYSKNVYPHFTHAADAASAYAVYHNSLTLGPCAKFAESGAEARECLSLRIDFMRAYINEYSKIIDSE